MVWRSNPRSAHWRSDDGFRRPAVAGGLRALLLGLCALALIAFAAECAQARSQRVDLKASKEENYGRLVLSFQGKSLLPEIETLINNGVFVVKFTKPVAVNVDQVPVDLNGYVSVARRDPDGLGLRFALARGVKVNTIAAGERLFIDFLPADWQGLPPNLPQDVIEELARRAEEAIREMDAAKRLAEARKRGAKITLRVGEHPTFTRLKFQWNLPFDHTFKRDGNTVTVKFNQVAELDLSDVKAHLPHGLSGIASDVVNAELKISLSLSDDVKVRAFREESAYVIDLTPVRDTAADPVNDAVAAALADESDGTNDKGRSRGEAQVSASQQPMPAPAGEAVKPPPARSDIIDSDATPSSRARGSDTTPAVAAQTQSSRGNPEALPKRRNRRAKYIRAEARKIGKTIRIVFPFDKPVAAAAFRRTRSFWLVFDTPVPIDMRTIRNALETVVDDIVVKRSGPSTTVRIDLSSPHLTTIGSDGHKWVVTIGDVLLEPTRPMQVVRSTTTTGQSILKVHFAQFASIREIDDPTVGDQIHVVTALGPARGLIKPQSFAELQTLPSAHGIAAVGYTDDFDVHAKTPDIVILGRKNAGLSLSDGKEGSPNDFGFSPQAIDGVRTGYIDLTEDVASPADFRRRLSQLRQQLAYSEEASRNLARRRIAQFYINQRMPFEAIGVLRALSQEDPENSKDSDFMVLMAAAQALAGRTKVALKILQRRDLEQNPDAAFWRTIAAANGRQWREAQKSAQFAGNVVGDYPSDVQAAFSLAAAESAIENNDYGAASGFLSETVQNDLSRSLAARRDLLRARKADAAGHGEEALTLYTRAADAEAGAVSVEAEYRALRLRHRDGLLSADRIIERLDQIAVGWRGDETELKVLRFLAQLRVETGDYRNAFEIMKSAVHSAPKAETARLIHEEIAAVFSTLFLEGKADDMPPVEALGLYYDFKEMTPVGRQGDEMVRRLANRLIEVDLLDQASELLQHQVDNRLKGAARSQIAADLASVYLLDHKPERALAVLSKTRQSLLPAGLDRQRRLIEARAMSETGRVDQALELVRNLSGSDVGRLRADVNWRAERWQKAGEELERLHQSRWSDSIPLDEQERIDLLKAAIAYSRAEDQISLDRLSTKFLGKMADSAHAKAFEVVTRPIDSQGVDFVDVARKIAATDSLDAFLQEYRQHYMSTPSSRISGAVAES